MSVAEVAAMLGVNHLWLLSYAYVVFSQPPARLHQAM